MENLFPYLTRTGKRWITSLIEEKLKKIVGQETYNGKVWIENPVVLNQLNRLEMANKIYFTYKWTFLSMNYVIDQQEFEKNIIIDLAKQIDRNIFTRYAMLKEIEKGTDKNKAKRKVRHITFSDCPEIICHYDHFTPGCPPIRPAVT